MKTRRSSVAEAPSAEPSAKSMEKQDDGSNIRAGKRSRRSSEPSTTPHHFGFASPDTVVGLHPYSMPTEMPLKSKSRLSRGRAPTREQETTIKALTPSCLTEIFKHLAGESHLDAEAQEYCRTVLPLVCKQWSNVLRSPSEVWKSLAIDRDLDPSEATGLDGDIIEAWLKPRAGAVAALQLGDFADATTLDARGVSANKRIQHRIIKQVAPTIERLTVTGEGSDLPVTFLADVAGAPRLHSLEIIANTCNLSIKQADYLARIPKLSSLKINFWYNNGEFEGGCLPSVLYELRGLTQLDISGGGSIKELSPKISQLSKLEDLTLHQHDYTTLPMELSRLTNLTSLRVMSSPRIFANAANAEASWIAINPLRNLRCLELSFCGISGLPDWNCQSICLTSLSLHGNSFAHGCNTQGFGKIAESCPFLEDLTLSSCSISVLPSTVEQIESINHLDVSYNNLVDLPADLGLNLSGLKVLKAAGNQFPALPLNALEWCSELTELDLSHCMYLEVASSVAKLCDDLKKLEILDLEKESSARFQPASVEWLKELNCLYKEEWERKNVVRLGWHYRVPR